MNPFIISVFFVALSFSTFGQIDQAVSIKSAERQSIQGQVLFLKDPSGRLSFKDVKDAVEFEQLSSRVPNFGIQDATFWFKFTLENLSNESLFLELTHPVLNKVCFFDPLGRGDSPVKDGQDVPHSLKEHSSTNILFDLKLKPGQVKTYYLKVNSNTQIQLPLYVSSQSALEEVNDLRRVFAALFFGVMLAMILYNLSIYFIVRDKSYLYYVLFVVIILVVQLVPKGFAYEYFWPESPRIANAAMFFSPALSGAAAVLFFLSFLNAKLYTPKLRRFLLVLTAFYGVGLLFFALRKYSISYSIIDGTSLILSAAMLIGAVVIYRKGNKSALFFLIAWSLFLAGVIVFVMKEVGVLAHNFFTNYTMMIGSGLETVLLSIGLANRINILKKEKDQAQKKELDALQKNDKLIKEQKFMLEQQVKERTKELQQALSSIQKAQQKLIESEKMASIGQLTAGIAHEINNPINYVTANITSLERDLEEIQRVIQLYSEISPSNYTEKLAEVEELKKELDYPYLQEEIPMLLDGIKEGANRTAGIVSSLRVFSNKDKEKKSKVNIALGLDSSLTLLSNKLDGIKVETDYRLDKKVYCFPGKLNQVFMNILSNAIDAIRERQQHSDFQGKIKIAVFEKDENAICVTVEDNGIGMNEEAKTKIFDPFYSSKDVGAGVGLGMSLTYQFIKLHSGEIQIDSTPNQGTKMWVCIKNSAEDE